MESTIDIYSPEWWASRHGCFTGSELWKLMTNPRTKGEQISKTAETYVLEKVWERLSGLAKQGFDNFATEWGNENEPLAKQWYTKLTGREVVQATLVYSKELPWLTGSPDGLVGADGVIEIKCPFNGANHLRHCCIADSGYFKREHPEYYWQCQCYMMLTGRCWTDFVSFDPRIKSDLGLFIYRLNADPEAFDEIEAKVKAARELFDQYYNLFSGQ